MDAQDFGSAAAAEDAEQVHVTFTLSFDSDSYEEHGDHVDVDYMNGEYSVQATLKVAGSDALITSNMVAIELANEDHYKLMLAADGNQANDSDGVVWHSGAVTATVLPVIYSGGQTISQVTLGLRDVAADGTVSRVLTSRDDGDEMFDRDELVADITDDEAPFEATWTSENASATDQKRVGGIQPGNIVVHLLGSAYSDGTAGPTETPMGAAATEDKPYFVRLDNKGPSVTNLSRAMQFNRHYDITNWVGAGHTFTFSSSSTTPDFSDGDGVGRDRSHHQYYAGVSTAEDDLAAVSTPNDLDETSNNRAYVLGVTVRDLLGNETKVWWAGTANADGLANTGSNRGRVDRTDDYKFGVDLTAPTQELVEDGDRIGPSGGVISNAAIAALITAGTRTGRNEVEIDYDDPGTGSGFSGSNVPVHTRIRRYAPDLSAEDGCLSPMLAYWHSPSGGTCEVLGDPGSNQWRHMMNAGIMGGTSGSYDFDGADYGYYAVEYAVMDDAGNRAPFIQTGGVIDETAPVGNALVPADREMGMRSTLSAFASDNLDLDRIEYFLGFGTDAYQVGSQSVGMPSLPFEQSGNASVSVETLPGYLATATAGTPAANLSAHVVRILDQAGNPTYASSGITGVTGTPVDLFAAQSTGETLTWDTDADGETAMVDRTTILDAQAVASDLAAGETLCWDVDGDGDCDPAGEVRTNLTFSIRGLGGLSAATGDTDDSGTIPATITAAAPTANPFERVVFYVQLSTGLTQDGVTTTWAYLGEGRGRPPTSNPDGDTATPDRQFSWRLNVRGADVAAARGLTGLTASTPVTIRAVGYDADGNAVTVTTDLTVNLTDDSY